MAGDNQVAERKLEAMLMVASRYRSYLEEFRNRGDTSGVAKCERLLGLNYSRIREHCAEHELDLPHDVPSEDSK